MKPVEYQNILAVDHLEKGYNYISSKGEKVSCPVLENISFQIEPKEFVGIMGRSGCGKTTLLKVLGMIDKPKKERCFIKEKIQKNIWNRTGKNQTNRTFFYFSGLLSYGQFIDKR